MRTRLEELWDNMYELETKIEETEDQDKKIELTQQLKSVKKKYDKELDDQCELADLCASMFD